MRSNVRPFRPRSTGPEWRDRIITALLYLLLGWVYSIGPQMGFTLFLLLVIVYWVFIHRNVIPTTYFLRFHYLQATMLFVFLYFSFYLLRGITELAQAGLELIALGDLGLSVGMTVLPALGLLRVAVMALMGISQALVALMGKEPRLPIITANVRYWA